MKQNTIFYITLALLFIGCATETVSTLEVADAPSDEISLSDEQIKNIGLSIIHPAMEDIAGEISLQGKIISNPSSKATVSINIEGKISGIYALPGNKVSKGQKIFSVNSDAWIELQRSYLNSQASLNNATLELNRQKELLKEKATTDKNYQSALERFEIEQANLKALENRIQLLYVSPSSIQSTNISSSITIHSPIDGYIQYEKIEIGTLLDGSTQLAQVSGTNAIAQLQAFENSLGQLKIGQSVTITSPVLADSLKTIITNIHPIVQSDGTYQVYCDLGKLSEPWTIGLTIKARTTTTKHTAILLEEEAVLSFEGKTFIFEKIGEGKFKMLEVQKGQVNEGKIEILVSPEWTQKTIVSKGAYALLMALKNKE
ncbi:MAG: efflux RND transporter periplasmic adaptor subunit [Flavobacteriales bacterium]|jgi:cobalt-zinc-cadmium efflux system membrane fusion protein